MFSKTNQVNPLNYFNCRQFTKKPHGLEFLKLNYDWNDNEELLEKWILENLKGRFYIGKHLDVDVNGKIQNMILVGFENPKELSLFNLSCPFIKRH
jgi:hypothetical protein|tara:strand:- start:725 stop:1012 length:288 start_codon:yes stop_codon:yes gene_type:complete